MVLSPNFILGLPRSGTTAVANVLSQNPIVSIASPKEPNIINSHKGTLVRDASEPNLKVYSSFFENLAYKIDASAHMFHCPLAPKRISELFPNSRFCIIIRNPVDRIESHWKMVNSVEILGKDWTDFRTAWNSELFLDSTKYSEPFLLWRSFFPKNRFLIINFDDLSRDICSVATAISTHFGINNDFVYSTPNSSDLNHSKFKNNSWWKIMMSLANKLPSKPRTILSRYIPDGLKKLIMLDYASLQRPNDLHLNKLWKEKIAKAVEEDYCNFKEIVESEFDLILPELSSY